MNRLEIFNESCILAASYHLFSFTDFVPEPDLQYRIGWSLIGVTVFNIVMNMFFMIYMTAKKIKLLCQKLKKLFDKWCMKKTKKDILEETSKPLKNEELKVEDFEEA
jgi:hypothetical protein